MSLGRVGEDRLDDLIAAIGKHKDVVSALEAAKSVDVDDTYILGPLLVLQHIFIQFGISTLLDSIVRHHPQLGFNFPRIIFTLIACRFINPSSKLKVFEHWQD